MSSTTTPVIGLFKPVPGTAEPFRVADLNANMDKLDTAYGTIGPKIVEADAIIAEVEAALADVTAKETQLDAYLIQASNGINAFEDASDDALTAFNTESDAALAALDTEAIIDAIIAEGITLDINGGTA